MKITQLPENWAPAFRDVIYRVEEAEDKVVDVEIESPDGELWGAKRFAGAESIDVNISGYLQSKFDLEPVKGGECRVVFAQKRSVEAQIAVGDVVSPKRVFLAAEETAVRGDLLAGLPRERQLAKGEWDELSFAVDEGDVVAVKMMVSGEKQFDMTFEAVASSAGVGVVVVDSSHIARQAEQEGVSFDECRRVDVIVEVGGVAATKIVYELVEAGEGSIRVCWYNGRGGVDMFTFESVAEEKVCADKRRYLGAKGYEAVVAGVERHLEIVGGYFPQKMAEALAEIMSARKAWFIDNSGEFVPLDVLTTDMAIRADELVCLKLLCRTEGSLK